jgi:hypothetical protein
VGFLQSLGGFQIDQATIVSVVGTLITTVAGGFLVMWRQAVAESKRKDQLIDRLVEQVMRTADGNTRIAAATSEIVSIHEHDRNRR